MYNAKNQSSFLKTSGWTLHLPEGVAKDWRGGNICFSAQKSSNSLPYTRRRWRKQERKLRVILSSGLNNKWVWLTHELCLVYMGGWVEEERESLQCENRTEGSWQRKKKASHTICHAYPYCALPTSGLETSILILWFQWRVV